MLHSDANSRRSKSRAFFFSILTSICTLEKKSCILSYDWVRVTASACLNGDLAIFFSLSLK